MTTQLAQAGGVIGCSGLALLLVASRRELRLAGLAAWALGGLLLLAYLVPRGEPTLLGVAAVGGLAVVVALAAIFHRWPWLVALAALACVPARFPIAVGATEANLLLPLYAVIGGAALALAYELFRGDCRFRELGPLAVPLAALLVWTGLSLVWSEDLREGSVALAAFYLPFGVLAVWLARLRWSRRWITALYAELAVLAVAFAAVGVYQWLSRDVFWNPKVIVGNAYAPSAYFYRVNSVFWDPSIYGRFLVVAIVASLVLVLYRAGTRVALLVAAIIAATWVGLLFSFSQSSFVALVVGVLAAAALIWRWRAAAALGLVAVVLLSVGFSSPRVRDSVGNASLDRVTSARASLTANGARVAAADPVAGVGIGGFKRAYADRYGIRGADPKRAASHNTPVTVAAETGLPGLLLFGWFLVTALVLAFRGFRPTLAGQTALACGLALVAIAVHSLFYAAFFEDPTTWALLALAVVAARAQQDAAEEPA
ncbi:MAG: O-antigen ligase family protein [Actinomycetota bacterium]|nr:O-antigen ligase family protein [Actinomycetota bacterium]